MSSVTKVNNGDLERIHAFCVGAFHRAAGNATVTDEARYCVTVLESVLGTPAALSSVLEASQPDTDADIVSGEAEGYEPDIDELLSEQGAEDTSDV